MHKVEEEFKRLIKLNSKFIFKYQAYKYFKESVKNIFTIQVEFFKFSDLFETWIWINIFVQRYAWNI